LGKRFGVRCFAAAAVVAAVLPAAAALLLLANLDDDAVALWCALDALSAGLDWTRGPTGVDSRSSIEGPFTFEPEAK
jgi:hypothetical protein